MIKIESKHNMNKFVDEFYEKISKAHKSLIEQTGPGNDFLGWIDLPENMLKSDEYQKMLQTSEKIKKDSDVLVVVGIGGSYLGARAVISALSSKFRDFEKNGVQVIFAGHHMNGEFINDLKDYLKDKDFSVNVISKSGTTTEPALTFRFLKQLLKEKYQDKYNERIYATTDKVKGALKQMATEENYTTFEIPDDVGGRFSVLTAVGLLPIMVANIDTQEILKGAIQAKKDVTNIDLNNPMVQYVAFRNYNLQRGKNIELMVNYTSSMYFFAEWWKQLFGESEGKDNKGIFPASAIFSTDLHSLGQYIQQGQRILQETVINFENEDNQATVIKEEKDNDELNYLAGKNISWINQQARIATTNAHEEGGVPNITLTLDKKDAYNIGYLIYFFEFSCAISGYVLRINPFDQPGVESYKSKMFELLGKK